MSASTQARVSALFIATAALVLAPSLADARGGRGGGGGGGRGGGGGGVRASGPSSVGGGHAARPSGGGRSSAASRPAAGGGQRAAAGGDRTNVAGGDRRTNVSGGDRANVGNRVNTGDINVNRNVNVDGGDWNNGGGWYDNDYHPVARGMAFGAAAAVTSAAIGSMMYSLPPNCSPYPYATYTYYNCGGVYYQPQYQGSDVTYVVVEAPG